MTARKSTKAALLAEQVPASVVAIEKVTGVAASSFDAALLIVLDSAIAEGKASGATLDAVRAAFTFSKDDEHVAKVRDEFYTGRMMARCGHEESAARVAIGKKPFNFLPAFADKMTDENRTEPEQRCINAARVRFAELLKECGIETARTGAGGAPRAPRAPGSGSATPPAIASGSSEPGPAKTSLVSGAISVPKAANAADVIETARRFEALIGEFLNASSAAFTGDTCAIVRNALIACRAELGRAAKLASDPKLAQIEALKAQLAALGA